MELTLGDDLICTQVLVPPKAIYENQDKDDIKESMLSETWIGEGLKTMFGENDHQNMF